MHQIKTSRDLVTKYGGPIEYSRRTGCSYSMALKYSSGSNTQSEYAVKMLDLALQNGYNVQDKKKVGGVVKLNLPSFSTPRDAIVICDLGEDLIVKVKCTETLIQINKKEVL